jgi:hypothetical protein
MSLQTHPPLTEAGRSLLNDDYHSGPAPRTSSLLSMPSGNFFSLPEERESHSGCRRRRIVPFLRKPNAVGKGYRYARIGSLSLSESIRKIARQDTHPSAQAFFRIGLVRVIRDLLGPTVEPHIRSNQKGPTDG